MNIEYRKENLWLLLVVWEWGYFRRHLWPGWMDEGKWSRWISPSPSQHISLKWSRWISSLLHNTLLASPHCINVISGKQIVKRLITIWSLKFRIYQIWLFTYWLGLVEQYNLYIWKEISLSVVFVLSENTCLSHCYILYRTCSNKKLLSHYFH